MAVYIDCGILWHIWSPLLMVQDGYIYILIVAFYGICWSRLLMVQDGCIYIYIDCGILWHMLISSFDGSGWLYIWIVAFYAICLSSSFDGSGWLYILWHFMPYVCLLF